MTLAAAPPSSALDQQLLDDLIDADAQGQRLLMSLWPGDQFYFRHEFWEVQRLQWHNDSRRLYVTTTVPEGEPYDLVGLDGETFTYQPHKTFLLYGALMFPAMLSDEHVQAETPELQEAW